MQIPFGMVSKGTVTDLICNTNFTTGSVFWEQVRVYRVLGQSRTTQSYCTDTSCDEDRLVQRIVELARYYAGYGYQRIMTLLREEGWQINHKRMLRLWRRRRVESVS
jgi:hypothetical protein